MADSLSFGNNLTIFVIISFSCLLLKKNYLKDNTTFTDGQWKEEMEKRNPNTFAVIVLCTELDISLHSS